MSNDNDRSEKDELLAVLYELCDAYSEDLLPRREKLLLIDEAVNKVMNIIYAQTEPEDDELVDFEEDDRTLH